MRDSIVIEAKLKLQKFGKLKLTVLLIIFIIGSAIFQDFLFSKLQNTGFYLSESFLYNSFWLFFLPFFVITLRLLRLFNLQNKFAKMFYLIGIGAVISFLHIILFTLCFVFISNVVFNPPHRFSSILNTVLSNQFYIAFIFYTITPYLYRSFFQVNQPETKATSIYVETLQLKGVNVKILKTSSIQAISTDKPYSIIHTAEQKILQNKSLKDFEQELDPSVFIRVHRSAIINKKFIKEMKSRKNGDYDVLIENGLSIRFSRHYRKNWIKLLH